MRCVLLGPGRFGAPVGAGSVAKATPPRIAFDPNHDALPDALGEEKRALLPDLISLPALRDPSRSSRSQYGALIGARRQLGALEELAAHVPYDEPGRDVNRLKRVGCRASRVVAVAHIARIAHEALFRPRSPSGPAALYGIGCTMAVPSLWHRGSAG